MAENVFSVIAPWPQIWIWNQQGVNWIEFTTSQQACNWRKNGNIIKYHLMDEAGGSLLCTIDDWLIYSVLHVSTGTWAKTHTQLFKFTELKKPHRNTQQSIQSRYATSTPDHRLHRQQVYQSKRPAKFSSASQYYSDQDYIVVLY